MLCVIFYGLTHTTTVRVVAYFTLDFQYLTFTETLKSKSFRNLSAFFLISVTGNVLRVVHETGYNGVACRNESVTTHF